MAGKKKPPPLPQSVKKKAGSSYKTGKPPKGGTEKATVTPY